MRYSVLLPTRNGGSFLRDCISSILGEPYCDMELIVSDNANTDQTCEVLAAFAGDRRLKVFRQEQVVDVTENWNRCLARSSGEYILLIGDDDCLLPGYFSRMDEILARNNFPDCVTYNAYSYISPGSLGNNSSSYYRDPFFDYGPSFSKERVLPAAERKSIVKDMFRFHNRIPLNIQTTLFSRRAMQEVQGPVFQPPFPDHYALNSLLLLADSWVFTPQKLLVTGISPKSFGHYVYSNKQEDGQKYLGIRSDFPGKLPGLELNNCMHVWLGLLKKDYPGQLKGIEISRGHYVRRQVYSWYLQYKARYASSEDLRSWSRLLSFKDWLYVLSFIFEKKSWQRLSRIVVRDKSNEVKDVLDGARQLERVSSIRQFVSWLRENNRIEVCS